MTMKEVGSQVASSLYTQQSLSTQFSGSHSMAKKRLMPSQQANYHLHQLQKQPMFVTSGFQESRDHWNPKGWDWDSARFLAKPLESVVSDGRPSMSVQSGTQKSRDDERVAANSVVFRGNHVVEDDENLLLKLGGGHVNSVGERPNKRVRSGSPAGGNYPMCQVDECKEDLSTAKDYHRRHKVCEVHSKATKAIVGEQMQRFCQQCSRFHLLTEFDEGKRSCRRRLAGHNRRRRKTQPDDVTSRLLPPFNRENVSNGDINIVNLLAILARAQGTQTGSSPDATTIPSQRSSNGSDTEKTRSPCNNLQNRPRNDFTSVGERSSTSYQSPTEYSDGQVQEICANIPSQMADCDECCHVE